nr:hypothetical protein Iba_chr03cCG0030 [Ipomoea batatas]
MVVRTVPPLVGWVWLLNYSHIRRIVVRVTMFPLLFYSARGMVLLSAVNMCGRGSFVNCVWGPYLTTVQRAKDFCASRPYPPVPGNINTLSPQTNCTATYTSNDTKFWAPICEDSITIF